MRFPTCIFSGVPGRWARSIYTFGASAGRSQRGIPHYSRHRTGRPRSRTRSARNLNDSDMLKRFWRAETGIFIGIWLGLLIAGRSRLFGDPGTLWHVVVGRQILASGQLPTTDSFTFTHAGQPWIAQQW